uniref:Reverse transcriptase domain-containing protein n=1 Tax=Haemonchus placei TaxID=6290 RepID=A0A0N4WZ07_HAEPC
MTFLLGQVPSIWKHAIVTFIPKSTESRLISSFRLISILLTPLEILEKIVNGILLWVSQLRCIPLKQHGFLPGSFTRTQLIDCTHCWIEAISSGRKVSAIYFDLSKAFDTYIDLAYF